MGFDLSTAKDIDSTAYDTTAPPGKGGAPLRWNGMPASDGMLPTGTLSAGDKLAILNDRRANSGPDEQASIDEEIAKLNGKPVKKFDLSTAKDVPDDTKKGFDLSTVKSDKPQVSKLESGTRGAVQGVSLDYSDELAGLTSAIFGKSNQRKVGPEVALKQAKQELLNDPKYAGLSVGELNTAIQKRADEIAGPNTAPSFEDRYTSRRDEERAANTAAQKANPLTYGAANIAGSIAPFALTGGGSLPAQIGKTALVSGAEGFGNATGDISNQAYQAGKSAVVGGLVPAAGGLIGKLGTEAKDLVTRGKIPFAKEVNAVKDFMPGSTKRELNKGVQFQEELTNAANEPASRAFSDMSQQLNKMATGVGEENAKVASKYAANKIPSHLSNTATDAVIGGAGAYMIGENPLLGAALGAAGGEYGRKHGYNTAKLYGQAAGVIGNAGEAVVSNAATKASMQALVNMSGDDAKAIKKKYDPKIQEAVDRGQPTYAATFQALSASPQYRAATAKDNEYDAEDDKPYEEDTE